MRELRAKFRRAALEFADRMVDIVREEVELARVRALADNSAVVDRLVAYVRANPGSSPDAIAQALGLKRRTAFRWLSEAHARGSIVRVRDGRRTRYAPAGARIDGRARPAEPRTADGGGTGALESDETSPSRTSAARRLKSSPPPPTRRPMHEPPAKSVGRANELLKRLPSVKALSPSDGKRSGALREIAREIGKLQPQFPPGHPLASALAAAVRDIAKLGP